MCKLENLEFSNFGSSRLEIGIKTGQSKVQHEFALNDEQQQQKTEWKLFDKIHSSSYKKKVKIDPIHSFIYPDDDDDEKQPLPFYG